MNEHIKQQILDTIKSYQRIIIMRHKRPDGDAVGSTNGLAGILRLSFPEKEIYVQGSDKSEYLSFLGGDDAPIDPALYEGALGIVLDTATEDRIANEHYKKCDKIIKIDHHIDIKPYGDISLVEDQRSSLCEMIADFYLTFQDELKIDQKAATFIYTGMVTDSGRFKYSSTSGDTLRCAAALLDVGIDTDTLFAHLGLKDFDELKFQAYVLKKMKITENGVAYIHVDKKMQKKFALSGEQASTAVSFLDSIKGSIAWLAFIDSPDGNIRVRLRSRFMTINDVAEHYHGGGHECAAGATVYSKKEMKALIKEADQKVKTYKAENEGWL